MSDAGGNAVRRSPQPGGEEFGWQHKSGGVWPDVEAQVESNEGDQHQSHETGVARMGLGHGRKFS